MNALFQAVAVVLWLTMIGGLVRVFRGPTAADQMMAALLFGSTGVAILLLLAETMQTDALRDVALVFGLLAAVSAVTFVRRAWPADRPPPDASPSQSDRRRQP
jgi:multicomponent Na+:H+ antiporter subunit F